MKMQMQKPQRNTEEIHTEMRREFSVTSAHTSAPSAVSVFLEIF